MGIFMSTMTMSNFWAASVRLHNLELIDTRKSHNEQLPHHLRVLDNETVVLGHLFRTSLADTDGFYAQVK